MTLNIGKALDEVRDQIMKGEKSGFALAQLGREAIFKGMSDPAWELLMKEFTSDKIELDRLCGRDPWFMNQPWGQLCLAYIAGDSTCTSQTATKTGTRRSMQEDTTRKMEELLDTPAPTNPNP